MLDARRNVLHYNSAATWWVNGPTPHGPVPMQFVRERLFSLIGETPNLDWLILTKRPENAALWAEANPLPPNVWFGVSVEDQETADARIPVLLRTPAAVRFISAEPLLGPIDLNKKETICETWRRGLTVGTYLDWVIVGGESGAKARPFHVMWGLDLMSQCDYAGVMFFWKQMGSQPIDRHGERIRLKDSHGGDWDEWPENFRVREVPVVFTGAAS